MGQPEQFAKRTFAADAGPSTGGAICFEDPPESSLTWVKADGLLIVRKPDAVRGLGPPWCYAHGHPQIVLEVKMPGDPINATVLDRIDLRRLARQIQRAEDPDDGWLGEQALWALAAYLPDLLMERRQMEMIAPGCYRVQPYPFDYIWIAANELPLRSDLIPFLVARSGKALQELVRWVLREKPVPWVMEMLQFVRMETSIRDDLIERIRQIDDPEGRAYYLEVAWSMFDREPTLKERATHDVRQDEARALLRRVLGRRKLEVSAEDAARIDACTDLVTLERWHDEAITAASAAEALR